MIKKITIIGTLAFLLIGCGGDDDGVNVPVFPPIINPTPTPDPNTPPPAATVGLIESIDRQRQEINVNGRNYKVKSVSYSNRDVPFDDLEVDMQVSTSGNGGSNQDVDVKVEPTLSGIIHKIDRTNGSFTVNGVPLAFKALSPLIFEGDWVMVSSTISPDGSYQVTSVVKISSNDFMDFAEIEGKVTDLNKQNLTFRIKGVLIDYANAQIFTLQLAEGQWVDVEGIMMEERFLASKIELDSYDGFDGLFGNFEIEGIISWVAADKSVFELNHRGRFNLLPSTYFQQGNKSMLTVGRHIEINAYSKNNKSYVTVVEFENDFDFDFDDMFPNFEFECTGRASNYTRSSFMMSCGFPATQRTIYIDYQTHFDEMRPDQIPYVYLDVEGVIINKRYIAREIEPLDFD